MMGALSSPSPLILRCILRRPPPFTATTTTTIHLSSITPSFFKHTSSISLLPTPPLPISRTALSSLTLRSLSTSSSIQAAISTEQTDVDSDVGIDDNHQIVTEIENPVDAKLSSAHKEMLSKLKGMSVKEKKELGSYANSLGKKLKSQQIGKSGVTDSVATALLETLEANELLKAKPKFTQSVNRFFCFQSSDFDRQRQSDNRLLASALLAIDGRRRPAIK